MITDYEFVALEPVCVPASSAVFAPQGYKALEAYEEGAEWPTTFSFDPVKIPNLPKEPGPIKGATLLLIRKPIKTEGSTQYSFILRIYVPSPGKPVVLLDETADKKPIMHALDFGKWRRYIPGV